jgi:hypothetical protein
MTIGASAHGNTVPISVTATASAVAEASAILKNPLCKGSGGYAAAGAEASAYSA